MLKVLHVLTDTNIGGAGTYVATYVKNASCDVSTSVLLPKNSKVLNLLEGADCEIIEADIAPDKSLDFGSVSVIRKILKEGKYDILHAHGSASARIAAKGVCKCVFTKHTLSESSGLISKLVYGALGGYAIAVSDASAKNLVELGFNIKRIYTVFNGVDDMRVPSQDEKIAAKSSFGIKTDKFVIGCVARFHPIKDHKTLLDAAKLALEKSDNLVFLFVGDGELKSEMEDYAKKIGIYSDCIFAGLVYDRHRAYHAMDVYTITSRHETFGLSMVESWSARIPSVITRADGLAEIASDGQTSIVCEVGDSIAISNAYLKLACDKELCDRLANASLERYKEKFSASIFAKNLENVYKDM